MMTGKPYKQRTTTLNSYMFSISMEPKTFSLQNNSIALSALMKKTASVNSQSVTVVSLSGVLSTVPEWIFPWSGKVVCRSVVRVLVPAVSVAASVEPSREPRVCSVEMIETVGDVMLWVLDAPELQ